MYYSSGNYEAFARPKKPADVDNKHAYIIGTGLAALSAACYLVRDGQMPGENIHILEKDPVPGGACDGLDIPGLGYVMRGGREMDNHFEVMWDLFRSIPSIETEGVSVLDEYYWLNKEDPNYSLCRATKNLGKDAGLKGKFGLSDKASMEIMKLFFTPDEDLYDKTIRVEFCRRLRPERKFASPQELKAEIQRNIQQTRDYFVENPDEAPRRLLFGRRRFFMHLFTIYLQKRSKKVRNLS